MRQAWPCSRSIAASRRAVRCPRVLHKLGEDVTEMLELVPRQWKVIQHVREKFSCRSCQKIAQPPAPSHPIARGRAGPGQLAHPSTSLREGVCCSASTACTRR